MNIFTTIVSILFITVVGFAVIRGCALLPKKSILLVLGLSYGLGVGLVTAQMYLYARIGVLWNIYNLILPLIVLMGLLYFFKKKHFAFRMPKFKKFETLSVLLLFGIGFCIFYTVFEALLRPLSVWDGWAAWIIKSKAFFLDKTISIPTLQYIRSDGPLVISLLGSFIYIVLGNADDTSVLLTSSAYYIFLLILFYNVLKERYGMRYALFFTFLLATTQTMIRQGGRIEAGQADLPLGYYFFACTLLLGEYYKLAKTRLLILLVGFLTITTFVKFDAMPFVLLVIFMISFVIYQKKTYYQLPILLLWFIPVIDWQYYKKIAHLEGIYMEGHGIVFSLSKMQHALLGSIKELVNVKSWNVLWIVYFYCVIFLFRRDNTELFVLNSIILSQLLIYLCIYFFTQGNAPESSAERLLMHIAPLALLVIAFTAKRKNSG